MLHRFLSGLQDQKARQQIEFVKDPNNIDEALDEVVKYQETSTTSGSMKEGTSQRNVTAAHTEVVETENPEVGESNGDETDEADSQVACATKPFHKSKKDQSQENSTNSEVVKTEVPMVTINQMKSLIAESEKSMKELLEQQAKSCNKGGLHNQNKGWVTEMVIRVANMGR